MACYVCYAPSRVDQQDLPIQTPEPTNLDIFSQVLHGYRRLRGNVAKRLGGLVGRWLEDVGIGGSYILMFIGYQICWVSDLLV